MVNCYETLASALRARFASSERGAAVVEYALLLALIFLVCYIAVQFVGSATSGKLTSVSSSIG